NFCHSRVSGNLPSGGALMPDGHRSVENRRRRSRLLFLWIPAFAGMTALRCLPAYAHSEATIASDELELRNNGEVTIFKGHVILKQDPYQVSSDRMVRTKATGIVEAAGHVKGTWISPKGEK